MRRLAITRHRGPLDLERLAYSVIETMKADGYSPDLQKLWTKLHTNQDFIDICLSNPKVNLLYKSCMAITKEQFHTLIKSGNWT